MVSVVIGERTLSDDVPVSVDWMVGPNCLRNREWCLNKFVMENIRIGEAGEMEASILMTGIREQPGSGYMEYL